MDSSPYHDGNIQRFIEGRNIQSRPTVDWRLTHHKRMMRRLCLTTLTHHSWMMRRLGQTTELQGVQDSSTLGWNSNGSLLMSGSAPDQIKIWSYPNGACLHTFSTGQLSGIWSAKFLPDTSDDYVVSAGSKQVLLFDVNSPGHPLTTNSCHRRRVNDLAVVEGNPKIIWSASADGTLRQHDYRLSCRRSLCTSVLLNLREARQTSLEDPLDGLLKLKSFDISSSRPHLVLVGGSDRFARLYDRRMLSPSAYRAQKPPPECVAYFCPKHLSDSKSRFFSNINHVTFSPDGYEVLIKYEGEHIYWMAKEELYDRDDVLKMTAFGDRYDILMPRDVPDAVIGTRSQIMRERVKNLLLQCTAYSHSIDLLSWSLTLLGIEPEVTREWLCTRASYFLKRMWKNDAYMAIRDCHAAKQICYFDYRPYFLLSQALSQLDRHDEAFKFVKLALSLDPDNVEIQAKMENIKDDINSDSRARLEASRAESTIFDEIEIHDGDPSSDEVSSESSGDEGHDSRSNLKPSTWKGKAKAFDMKQRFIGPRNMGINIQQANFLGQRGEYIASGSDDGRLFIWEKCSGRLLSTLSGDGHAVTCVQCHPTELAVATSGIDTTVKIWTPSAAGPSSVTDADLEAIARNQQNL